jgi:hypothetical protein
MSMLDDGSELEFKTSSKSGIMALQKLSKEFGTKCHLHVDDNGEAMMPIVEIGSVSFPDPQRQGDQARSDVQDR